MSVAELEAQLVEVQASISQALKGQKWKHGEDEAELPDLSTLREMEKDLKAQISRRSRGMRATGIRLRHN